MDAARHLSVRELHHRPCHHASFTDRINVVPAITASTAFFTFLRANLVLNPSAPSSNPSTPYLQPAYAAALFPPPSPAPLGPASTSPGAITPATTVATAMMTTTTTVTTGAAPRTKPVARSRLTVSCDDDVPPLSLDTLDNPGAKDEGLELVAQSVAQMRRTACHALLTHPLCLASLAIVTGTVFCFARCGSLWRSLALSGLLAAGLALGYVLAAYHATRSYASLAQSLAWPWLRAPDGEHDLVLGARQRDGTLVGALILRLQTNPALSGRRRGRALALRGGRGVIRAWTTRAGYRRRGIGSELLSVAVRVTKERCGRDADVGFAKEHANSVMLLPDLFNAVFRRAELRAATALHRAVAAWEAKKRRR